jgi:membrane protein YdbS with pleckstrin-like domain
MLPEPTQRLAPEARNIWRLEGAGWSAALLVAAIVGSAQLGQWDGRPGWLAALIWVAWPVAAALLVVVVPELRWRRWRWEVRETEIDIRHGVWAVRRTLVPMARVQHVDTESGLLQQAFELATVSFHTAAGETEIPQLRRQQAEDARLRIAQLARTGGDV